MSGTITTDPTLIINQTPVVSGSAMIAAFEDGGSGTLDRAALLAYATDPDIGDTLEIQVDDLSLPAGVVYNHVPGYTTVSTTSYYGYTQLITVPTVDTLTIDTSDPAYQSLAAGEVLEVVVNYNITDGINVTPAQAIFRVIGTNDAPVVSGAVQAAATEGDTVITVSGIANATDVDHGAVLSVVAAPPPAAKVEIFSNAAGIVEGAAPPPPPILPFDPAILSAGVTFDAATNSFSIDPTNAAYASLAAGQTTTVTVDYGVSDGIVATAASVSFTVTGVNDAPIVSGPVSGVFVNEGVGTGSYDLAALISAASDIDQNSKLTVTIDAASLPDGVRFTTTPEQLVPGYTIPAYVIPAGPRGTSWGAYVYPAQYIPEQIVPDQIIPATTVLTIDPSNAAYQSLAQGESMNVVVNYMVTDGEFSTPAQAIFVVNGMNDAPVLSGPITAGTAEGDAILTIDALANATDVDHGSVLSVVAAPPSPSATPGADSPQDVLEAAALAAAAPIAPLPFDASTLPAGVTFDAAMNSFSVDPTNAAYQYLSAGQTQLVTINYGVTDGLTVTAASIVLTVVGTNDAPVVSAPTQMTVSEDAGTASFSMAALLANATDVDSLDTLQVTNIQAVLPAGVSEVITTGGLVSIPDPTAYYGIRYVSVPAGHSLTIDTSDAAYQSLAQGETMDVTVTYDVSDGTVSTPTTAVFTVVGANDAPVVSMPASAAVLEDGAAVTLDALATTTDADHGAVLSVVNMPTILPAGVTYDAATQNFTFDPTNADYQSLSAGQMTQVVINYGVTDGIATTAASAVFNVTGTNDAPVVTGPLAFMAQEDVAPKIVNLLANASDVDMLDVLHVTGLPAVLPAGFHVTTVPGGYYQPDVTVYTFNAADPAFQSLAAGEQMTVRLNYSVTDGSAAVTTYADFTVIGTNDAPVISVPISATMMEDAAPITLDALATASDVDHGAVLSVVSVPAILPAGITYDAATHGFSINPADSVFQALAQGETHTYSVTYGVTDGLVTTPTQVNFTVIGVNDAPAISGPVLASPNEDGQVVTVNATGNATDVDAHQGVHATGVPSLLPAGVTFDAATDRFSFDPGNAAYQYLSKGETVDVVINYNIFDGFVEVPTSIIFAVTGKNDTPTVSGVVQGGTVTQNGVPVTLDLLTLAGDVDHLDVLGVKLGQGFGVTASVASGTWATPIAFSLTGNSLSIDPAQFKALGAGESLDIVFNYTITDGNAGGDVAASAHVTITGQNDAPVGIAISQAHVPENSVAGTVVGQLRATDADRNDTFTYQITSDPSGFFAISGSQLVVAAGATLDYETATLHSIDVMVTDASGVSTSKTFVIAVDNLLGVVINGTSGNDTYNATTGTPRPTVEDDTINGNGGNDLLDGLAGNDIINGGTGNDIVNGGAGDDTIILIGSESLDDTINAGNTGEVLGDAVLVQGGGAVTLANFDAAASFIERWIGNGRELLGTGNIDHIDLSGLKSISGLTFVDSGSSDDIVTGSAFADDLRGNSGNDTLNGGGGADILTGGTGNDVVNGGDGNDRIIISGSDGVFDVMNGGAGTDTLVAINSGALSLTGFNATASSIEAWEGNGKGVAGTSASETFDFSGITAITGAGMGAVDAGDGADTVTGTAFADDLRGAAGNDIVHGGNGNDVLDGGAANDSMFGDAGNDTVKGGDGTDIVNGGAGSDILTGGASNDWFMFFKSDLGSGQDSITDFVIGTDKIVFQAADFGLTAGSLSPGDFVVGTAANAGHQQFFYDAASKTLSWDSDGIGSAAAVVVTNFSSSGALALQSTDFLLV